MFVSHTLFVVAESLRVTTFSVLVYAATGSPLWSAVAFAAGFLPHLPGSMLLGSLADRLPPRALLAGGYLLGASGALLIALVHLPVGTGLLVVVVVALPGPVFNGASGRLVAQFLEGDAYVLGRSLNNIAGSAAQLAGLALGGTTVAVLGTRQALVAAAVLYLSAAAVVRLGLPRLPAPPVAPADTAVVRASLAGNLRLLRLRPVRLLLLAQWLPSSFTGGAEGLIVAYAGQRHFPAGTYAVLMAALPVGMLAGDLVVGRLLAPRTREQLVLPLITLMGLAVLGFALEPGRAPATVLLLLAGCGFAYQLGLQRPFLESLPPELHGQAFGLLGSGIMTLQGVAPVVLAATATAAGLSTGTAMGLTGALTLAAAVWIATCRPRPTSAATTAGR
ncbi:MFS transporter [Streptacidiphilus sp. N1-12]|uniref:MFS transporter n=2 Tax=Streptacidiphilus alkalitolerans TaxID=3342712 RepID=A0ABV6VK52_9ACTN